MFKNIISIIIFNIPLLTLSFIFNIFDLIDKYGVYIVFLTIFLEYACFPLPSEVILPIAGAICYNANLSLILVIIFSVISGLCACIMCYYIGYFSTDQIKKRLNKKRDNIQRKESLSLYNKYKNFAILFGRLIPLCRTYISFVAGAKKHNIVSYIILSLIGISIWNTALISLGYYFYDNIDIITVYYKDYKIIIISVICFVIILLILKKFLKKKEKKCIDCNY